MKIFRLCFVFVSPVVSIQAETRDLIIVAGQSNAVGFDAYASELPADAADKDVLFWWKVGDPPPDEHDVTSGGAWKVLQPQPKGSPMLTKTPEEKKTSPRQYGNFAKSDGGFGPEIGFARELKAKEGKSLAIVKAAFSGTAVAQDWNPDDPGMGGSCYRALVKEVNDAMAAAKEQDIGLRPRALVWVQGESDATAVYAPAYEKNLGYMLGRLRKELSAPGLVALIGVNVRFGNDKNPHMPAVIAAQRAVAEKDPLTEYVDTTGAETLGPSHTHFTANGTLEVGRRYAQALLNFKTLPKGEPTNAAEAAVQKAKADADLEKRYQDWVAKLPSDQQAWERVLQNQLGGFYLPIHKREKVAGRSNAWDFVQDHPTLPRVLLIGDSVSRGYTQAVRKLLSGKANVHRAPANCGSTANGIKNIDVWLGDGNWDLIHFNFGIHDRNTPIVDYTLRLEQLIARLKKAGTRLVWASSTPCPDTSDGKYKAAPIIERNTAAVSVMKEHKIPVNDLFAAITPHLKVMQNPDDVHFTAQGYDFLGEVVAKAVEAELKKQ